MDNVPTLSIWATMVNDLPQIFSPQTVIEIGDVAVGKIASESPHIVTQREELETRLAMLKRGREECELQISKSNFSTSYEQNSFTLHNDLSLSKQSDASKVLELFRLIC